MKRVVVKDYAGDSAEILNPLSFPSEVWLHVTQDGYESGVMLTPKEARKVAKALKRAAKRAES